MNFTKRNLSLYEKENSYSMEWRNIAFYGKGNLAQPMKRLANHEKIKTKTYLEGGELHATIVCCLGSNGCVLKMGSRGQEETQKLRENLESQLDRLIQQLADLEEVKDELDESEYNETKEETLEQLKEFNERLSKMISGNMTLVDHLGLMQMATQAAISEAFSTPEVIRMFARREPKQLRQRLFEAERDFKLGQLEQLQYNKYKKELLTALKQLGETLSDDEIKYISDRSTKQETLFEKVSENSDNVEEVIRQVTRESQSLNKT